MPVNMILSYSKTSVNIICKPYQLEGNNQAIHLVILLFSFFLNIENCNLALISMCLSGSVLSC